MSKVVAVDEFEKLVGENFGPVENTGMLAELVTTVEGMVEGGTDLPLAVWNSAQEMIDTLNKIQRMAGWE